MHFYWTFPDCERPVRVLDIKLSRVFPGQMRLADGAQVLAQRHEAEALRLKDVAEVLRR